ncbi:MAG: alpha/beta fold hydrolase [Arenicellaceae bacterium]|nr:alpha/beta fold hydrolase [Arenicellaceae bacterium]
MINKSAFFKLINASMVLFGMSVVLISTLQSAAAQHIEDGKLIFPERRITVLSYQGADEAVLNTTALKIKTREGDGPGSWLNEWRSIGQYYENVGDSAIANHQRLEAHDAYLKANVYYSLSWFPGNHTPLEDMAYQSQLNVYRKAGALFDVPLEVMDIPYRDGKLIAYLHRPVGVENPPLIIWTGGSDQYKANHYRSVREMNRKGMAVVTFDLPGFGESKNWLSTPDADDAHMAILDYFITKGEFKAQRISFVGVSWGGHFALRVAARNDPRINAVAAFCAPAHETFVQSIENIEYGFTTPERMTYLNLAPRIGAELTPAGMQQALKPFSLFEAGLLGQGQTIKTPLLIANGTLDDIVPVSDLMLAYESAVDSDIWLLGRGNHCAGEYRAVVIPQLADWLLEKFNRL